MDVARPDLKDKRRRRQRLWIAAAVVGVVVVGAGLATLDSAAPVVERETLYTARVQAGEMLIQVRGNGVLVPRDVRYVAALTEGRVERVLAKPGAIVEADTVIAELVNPEIPRQLEEAELALEEAVFDMAALRVRLESDRLNQLANVAQVRADAESARLTAEAEGMLFEDNIIPEVQYQSSLLRAEQLAVRLDIEQQRLEQMAESIQAQVDAQSSRVSRARRTVERRTEQVEGLTVRAGMPGVLQEVSVEPGQNIVQGASMARVARPDLLIAELRVPQAQVSRITLGQPVIVDTRSGEIPGEIIRIDPGVVNGTVQVDVGLIGELPAAARPDLSVDGVIEIERIPDTLFVSRPSQGANGDFASLFRVDVDGSGAQRIQVELGSASVNVIQILNGLREGDEIILSDVSRWEDFDRLVID
jgi:HlyD family secretion protein